MHTRTWGKRTSLFSGKRRRGSKLKSKNKTVQKRNAAEVKRQGHDDFTHNQSEDDMHSWWLFFGHTMDQINGMEEHKEVEATPGSLQVLQPILQVSIDATPEPKHLDNLYEILGMTIRVKELPPLEVDFRDFYELPLDFYKTFGPSQRSLQHTLQLCGNDYDVVRKLSKHSIVHSHRHYIKQQLKKASREVKCMAERRQQIIRLNMISNQQPVNIFQMYGNKTRELPNMNNVKGMDYRKLALSNCLLQSMERESQDHLIHEVEEEMFVERNDSLTNFLNSDFDDLNIAPSTIIGTHLDDDTVNQWLNEFDEVNMYW